ncbi:MAG: glycosyl transferase, partial [Planctomycetales bacterium]|nr:glycosyl transferase [Planctomycetales bacterium]
MVSGSATGYLIAGFAISAALVFLMLRAGRAMNILAVPNARSSHVTPTPTAGGLGFVIPLLGFFGMLYLDGLAVALAFLLGLVLVAAASLWDDLADLSAGLRFGCQTIAVALIVWQLDLPWPWYLLALTGLVLVWHVNLFNFMDGIDGI